MSYVAVFPDDVIGELADNQKIKYIVMDDDNGLEHGVYDLDVTMSVESFVALLNCDGVMFYRVVE